MKNFSTAILVGATEGAAKSTVVLNVYRRIADDHH